MQKDSFEMPPSRPLQFRLRTLLALVAPAGLACAVRYRRPGAEIAFEQLLFGEVERRFFQLDAMPQPIRDLQRQRVKIRGYGITAVPRDIDEGRFLLLDDQVCRSDVSNPCRTILVEMRPGMPVPDLTREIEVQGTLEFRERFDDGYLQSLYVLTDATVRLSARR